MDYVSKTDEYARELYSSDTDYPVAERVVSIAARRGVGPAQIGLAWLLAKPGVTALIVGASRLEHLDAAVAASGMTLAAEEIAFPEEPYQPLAVLGHS